MSVLNSENILKVGCAVNDDSLDLYNYESSIQLNGRLDLGGIGGCTQVRVGLKNMTLAILGIELEKSRRVMLSDWSKKLDEEQMEYACRDAWAGGRVFERLREVWLEVFGEEVLEGIVGMQMNVVELGKEKSDEAVDNNVS